MSLGNYSAELFDAKVPQDLAIPIGLYMASIDCKK